MSRLLAQAAATVSDSAAPTRATSARVALVAYRANRLTQAT